MEIIQCKLFMITKPTKKHSYILYFILGALLRVIFPDIYTAYYQNYQNEQQDKNLSYLVTQKYCEIIRNIISALFLGFAHFYYKIRSQDKNVKNSYNDNSQKSSYNQNYVSSQDKNIKNSYNDNSQKSSHKQKYESNRNSKMIIIFLIISTIDIICQMLIPLKYILEDKIFKNNIIDLEDYHLYFLMVFDIFARYMFSRMILKTYFYAHHKLSFILCIIGLVPISILDIYYKCQIGNHENGRFDLLFITVISIKLILYSLEDIMNKVAFRSLSILPCTLIFYNGLVQLCYIIIISLLLFFFELINIKYIDFKFQILYASFFIPFDIIRHLYLIKVIDKFSAQYMVILKISERVAIFAYIKLAYILELKIDIVKNFGEGENYLYLVYQIAGFLLLLISSLIHNEFIIINIPFLKAKTEYFLNKDAYNEKNTSCYTDTYFSESINEDDTVTNIYDEINGSDISS